MGNNCTQNNHSLVIFMKDKTIIKYFLENLHYIYKWINVLFTQFFNRHNACISGHLQTFNGSSTRNLQFTCSLVWFSTTGKELFSRSPHTTSLYIRLTSKDMRISELSASHTISIYSLVHFRKLSTVHRHLQDLCGFPDAPTFTSMKNDLQGTSGSLLLKFKKVFSERMRLSPTSLFWTICVPEKYLTFTEGLN